MRSTQIWVQKEHCLRRPETVDEKYWGSWATAAWEAINKARGSSSRQIIP
jgi:hypothetical protein